MAANKALDVAMALRYLHEREPGVVHFNVCTQNVLINNSRRGVLGGLGFSEASNGCCPLIQVLIIPH